MKNTQIPVLKIQQVDQEADQADLLSWKGAVLACQY